MWISPSRATGPVRLDELEGHRDSSGAAAGSLRDRLSEPGGGEGGFGLVVRRWIECSALLGGFGEHVPQLPEPQRHVRDGQGPYHVNGAGASAPTPGADRRGAAGPAMDS